MKLLLILRGLAIVGLNEHVGMQSCQFYPLS